MDQMATIRVLSRMGIVNTIQGMSRIQASTFPIHFQSSPCFSPRKIRNRAAAQNSRDRQKAKMAQLQQRVLELEQKVL